MDPHRPNPVEFWIPPRSGRGKLLPSPALKAAVAGVGITAAYLGVDEPDVARWMTGQLRRQWSVVNALQYLTGQEGRAAIRALPEDFEFAGAKKQDIAAASVIAAAALADADKESGRSESTINFVNMFRPSIEGDALSPGTQATIRQLFGNPNFGHER